MSKNKDQLATLNATLPDSVRENLANSDLSNSGSQDQRVAFTEGDLRSAYDNTLNAARELVKGSSVAVGFSTLPGSANFAQWILLPVTGDSPVTFSSKTVAGTKLPPVLGINGIKLGTSIVGTVNTKTGAQEAGLGLSAVIPTPFGAKVLAFINVRGTSWDKFNVIAKNKTHEKFTVSCNFGIAVSATDISANATGLGVGGFFASSGMGPLGFELGVGLSEAIKGGMDVANTNAWVGLANRASVTFQDGHILSIKIGNLEIPANKINELAINVFNETQKVTRRIDTQLHKAGITVFDGLRSVELNPAVHSTEVTWPSDQGRNGSTIGNRTQIQSRLQEKSPLVGRKPEYAVLGVNTGGSFKALDYNYLVARKNNVATDVIQHIYKNDLVNVVRKGTDWIKSDGGNWITPQPIDGRPGEQWQMRLNPKDKSVLEMRFTENGYTYGYSAHLGADGKFKVDGDRKLRDLPPYLEDRVRGIDRAEVNTQTQNENSAASYPIISPVKREDVNAILNPYNIDYADKKPVQGHDARLKPGDKNPFLNIYGPSGKENTKEQLKGSDQRISKLLTSDNSNIDTKKSEQSLALTNDRQKVTNLTNTKQLAMVPNSVTGKIDIVDNANTVHASYKGDVTREQIQTAMSIPGPLFNKGDPLIAPTPTVVDNPDAQGLRKQLASL